MRSLIHRAAIGLALAFAQATAVRADGEQLRVRVVPGGCPSALLLEQKLAPLLGAESGLEVLAGEAGASGDVRAWVRDAGDRYGVEIDGLTREYSDPARDCVERARVAAVLIALNTKAVTGSAAPPEREPNPKPKPEPTPVAPAPEEAEALASDARLQWGGQLFGAGAYASAIDRGAAGGGAGIWLGKRALRFGFSAGALTPARFALTPSANVRGSVGLMRLPFALHASYLSRAGAFELGPTLGAAIDVLRLEGAAVAQRETAVRLNLGALLAGDAQLRFTPQLSLALRAGIEAFPRAYRLVVDPAGALGKTPRLWLFANLGLEWRML